MNHFSRKNLRFLAHLNLVLFILGCPNNGIIVVSFLLIMIMLHFKIKLKGFKSIAICYMCLLQTPSLSGRRCLVFLVRFAQSARRGHVKGEGDLLFSPLARARASSKFLLPPYKLQRGFAERSASPSLLFPGMFNTFDTALKPELV